MHENFKLRIAGIGFERGYFPVTEKGFDFIAKRKIDVAWLNLKDGKIDYAFEIEMPSSRNYAKFNKIKLEELAKNGTKVLHLMIHPDKFEVLYTNLKTKELRSVLAILNPKIKTNAQYCKSSVVWVVEGKKIKIERWLKSLLEFYMHGSTGIMGTEMKEYLTLQRTIPYLIREGLIETVLIKNTIGILLALMTGSDIFKFGSNTYTAKYQLSKKGQKILESKFNKNELERFTDQIIKDIRNSIINSNR